jgi:hypothetical protein
MTAGRSVRCVLYSDDPEKRPCPCDNAGAGAGLGTLERRKLEGFEELDEVTVASGQSGSKPVCSLLRFVSCWYVREKIPNLFLNV